MKNFAIILFGIILSVGVAFADVFSHPYRVENIQLPQFQNVVCKFTQEKVFLNSSSSIKSGGNFRFVKDRGVTFETVYPFKMVTSYTSDENRRISGIISAINKKDYSYLNRNFKVFYEKNGAKWTLALKPKSDSKINAHIASIILEGGKYIDKIGINTIKNGSTKINFTECK